jgi:hypothetical protein
MSLASPKPDATGNRARMVFVGFLLTAGFLLVAEHRAHLLPYLGYAPWLLLLACPLVHLFMHGHGHSQSATKEK